MWGWEFPNGDKSPAFYEPLWVAAGDGISLRKGRLTGVIQNHPPSQGIIALAHYSVYLQTIIQHLNQRYCGVPAISKHECPASLHQASEPSYTPNFWRRPPLDFLRLFYHFSIRLANILGSSPSKNTLLALGTYFGLAAAPSLCAG